MGKVSLGGDWQTGGCAVVVVSGLVGLAIAAWRIGTVIV